MRFIVTALMPYNFRFLVYDSAVASLALPFAFLLREDFILKTNQIEFLIVFTPLAGLIAFLAFRSVGVHRVLWRYATMRDFLRLVAGSALAVIGFMATAFLYDRLENAPRSVPVIQWLIMSAGLCGGRVLFCALDTEQRSRAEDRQVGRSVLLVGGGSAAALVARMLAAVPSSPWRPVGILDDRCARGQMVAGIPVLGRLDDVREVIGRLTLRGMRPECVIITVPYNELGLTTFQALQQVVDANHIPIENLPDLLRFRGEPSSSRSVLEWPVLLASPLDTLERRSFFIAKRSFDILVSITILITMLPLFLMLILSLRLTIGGPTLFGQVRPGRGHVPFILYKLRTMRDVFDSDGAPLSDSLRTPWLGRVLRRTRLDELPQFWNVLIGDMSVVGPRPLIESDLAQLPDGGLARHAFRPGITGWAQVHGGHQLSPVEKATLDLWYIRHASLALDLKIIFLTIRTIILGERVSPDVIDRAKSLLDLKRPESSREDLSILQVR